MDREVLPMTAIETEDHAPVSEDRPRPRLLLAQRMKPQRDRAVVRALLRVLGVTFAESEVIAPVEAPIDVRFRQAQFHLRELGDHPQGYAWHAQDKRGHQASTLADSGDLRTPAVGMDLTMGIAHVTAALAQHAAWYGARCVGLDVVVSADEHYCLLAQPAEAPEIGALALQGWRSVSVLCPPYGMVLYTASGAPEFLRLVTGRLLRQWDNIETLFAGVKH
jgi:Putative endonuclease, protein of unknown function (DUF1780)